LPVRQFPEAETPSPHSAPSAHDKSKSLSVHGDARVGGSRLFSPSVFLSQSITDYFVIFALRDRRVWRMMYVQILLRLWGKP